LTPVNVEPMVTKKIPYWPTRVRLCHSSKFFNHDWKFWYTKKAVQVYNIQGNIVVRCSHANLDMVSI